MADLDDARRKTIVDVHPEIPVDVSCFNAPIPDLVVLLSERFLKRAQQHR